MKIGIIYADGLDSVEYWIKACEKRAIDYITINLCNANWLELIISSRVDFIVQRPPGEFEHLKVMYDERILVISKYLEIPLFPSYDEVSIYENKKMLSYFLKANSLPCPSTQVFYVKQDAIDFVLQNTFPIVAKTSIGAAGSGVKIIHSKEKALKYINDAFSGKGIKRRFGPNPNHGTPTSWVVKALKNPSYFVIKLKSYLRRYKMGGQTNYVIFQEYIKHDYEWRITKCGDYYYGFKKLLAKGNDKCSGGGSYSYSSQIPLDLMDFVRRICEQCNFNSMAVDIFVKNDSEYLVNELQTHWGVDDEDVMLINEKKGVYRYNSGWEFIEGDFWGNLFFDMRLSAAINLFENNSLK